ncbi:Arb2 domain-domain-containing protein [Clohesyomyces aquaticus]|uniref:Arb2 domain-domain-containing protein n=1 Tax=Clohesyomyces aquaticus TaxID=1231657 RepID=A0A1Y2AAS9_9PLEO|nr:Arb2 domain-domain-containing protein [Clohesyomyces aquaticus]
MAQFRAKMLDIGCYVNIRNIRDHTKRKVFAANETERHEGKMFRRVEQGLPPDAAYEADMKKLGYFINETGHIRMIAYPDHEFQYHFSNQERHNEVHREAMQVCQRREVAERLAALGLTKLYLPTLSTTKPNAQPHVPILAPPANILKSRKRIIVVINDSLQDLGILAYRQLQRELGLNGGSIVNFAKEMVHRSAESKETFDIFRDRAGVAEKEKETPGLIVMNTGQSLYSHKFNEAMTIRSWQSMPRKSICHESIKIHELENRVEGHRTPKEHIEAVFNKVIKNPDFVSPDAEIYVIAIENGADHLLEILDADLNRYAPRITALAFSQSSYVSSQIHNPELTQFLHQRARQWKLSSHSINPRDCVEVPKTEKYKDGSSTSSHMTNPRRPISWLEKLPASTPMSAVSGLLHHLSLALIPRNGKSRESSYDSEERLPLCPTFAGGNQAIGECVFTEAEVQKCILDFFEEVAQDPKDFHNPEFKLAKAITPTPGGGVWGEDAGVNELMPPEMSPKRMEIDNKKAQIENMKVSIKVTPKDNPELEPGRKGLEKRLVKAEQELEDLLKKGVATGGLVGEEAEDVRERWEPVGTGPKIPFAGTMVDSELVRGAGLLDTADEALEELGDAAQGSK